MVINIIDLVQSADTPSDGEKVRVAVLNALRSDGEVVVSFEGINVATSSFVNVAFVTLLDAHGFDEIRARLKIIDSSRQINELVRDRMRKHALAEAA